MTVTANIQRADYNCNGATTLFTVPFQFFLNTEIQVIKTDNTVSPAVVTPLNLTTDYTVAGGAGSTGSITTVATFPTGVKISILPNLPFTQNAHYVPNDPFPATTHEAALDRLTLQDQQLEEKLGRAAVLPPTVAGVNPALPVPTPNAVLAWDATGANIVNGTSATTPFSSATPIMDGTGAAGTAAGVSHGDHQHPTDTSRAPVDANGLLPSAKLPLAADKNWGTNETTTTGLTYGYYGGIAWTGAAYANIAGGTVALTASSTNYVQRTAAGVVSSNTVGWTVGQIPMAQITTGVSSITTNVDQRLHGAAVAASVEFQQAGTGGAASTVDAKLKQYVSVKDFGAVGNGIADDTTAIQNAINTGFAVLIPSGTYKVSSSLTLKGDIYGNGNNSTQIAPSTATFAVFVNNATSSAKYKVRGLFINWGPVTGGIAATNSACIGFKYIGTVSNQYDYEFSLKDIWMSCPYYGIYDQSSAYMYQLTNVRVDNCVNGIVKNASGTTITLQRCYINGYTGTAYSFTGVNGLELAECAMDGGTTAGGATFSSCYGLFIHGFDYEANTFNLNYSGAVNISSCAGFEINGMRGFNNTVAPGGNYAYILNINGTSYGTIRNAVIGATETATGTGSTTPINVTASARVSVQASTFSAISGGTVTALGPIVGLNAGDTCVVDFAESVSSPAAFTQATNAKFANKALNGMSADNGDASIAGLVSGISNPIQLFNTPLTANRTVGFGSTLLYNGATFRVVRTTAATGASTLTVNGGTAKALAVGQWVDYTYNGTSWVETAFGSL